MSKWYIKKVQNHWPETRPEQAILWRSAAGGILMEAVAEVYELDMAEEICEKLNKWEEEHANVV